MGKVLAINGSPNSDGNTAHMLRKVLEICEKSGHETAFYQAGGRPVLGCKACWYCCDSHGKCAQDDWINELYPQMEAADAILLGSPTYYADLTPEIKAVIDRCGFVAMFAGRKFSRKIGAGVAAVRRAGSIHVLDSINHFFHISDMVVPGSTYWNMGLANSPGDFEKDEEGIATMTRLGENIVWLLEKLG